MTTTTFYAPPPLPGGGLWESPRKGPFRQLVRFRVSQQPETALVLIDRDHLAVWEPRGRASLRKAAFGRYTEAHLVDTARRSAVWQMSAGPRLALEVTWWAEDPGLVVLNRHRLTDPWAFVSTHLDGLVEDAVARFRAAGRELGAQDLLPHLTQPHQIPHVGLACCVETLPPQVDPLDPAMAPPPRLWSPQRREEYEFYLQAVRTGPDALAALWLLHHPDQVRDVLEWVTAHPREIAAPADGADLTRTLFDGLPVEIKEQLAKANAERLQALLEPGLPL